ncbi:hypothetical protein [Streptomyces sp. NBC_00038]|uniref:hypothetical protein n=1 Tax=Streptomyces sp. NBC_00038 TaxID=2903615 RepID=UPI00224DCAE8|nr:hypothetical protein [Streptomyces sp. NBC_00038]MCX5558096.1 hypothetical protein [Streptomyces sp. NBC_00038]
MSAGSRAGRPETARKPQRSTAGNIAFAAGLILVLASTILGAFAGVYLTLKLADESFLSPAIPEDGRIALVIGGVGFGAMVGGFLPLTILGLFGGTDENGTGEKPRLRPIEASRKMLGVLLFGIYLVVVSVVVAQLGWILPEGLVVLAGVFAVGFGWVPLALLPWERFGLEGVRSRFASSKKAN